MGMSAAIRHGPIERSITACNGIGHVSNAILKPLQARLGACGAGFSLITTNQNRLVKGDLSIARGTFESLTPTYTSGMFREDPLYRGRPEVPETLTRYAEGHGEEADRLKGFYDSFLKARNIHDCMGVYFEIRGVISKKIVSLSFGRSAGSKKFSDEDRRELGQVGTLLRLVLSNIALRHEAELLWEMHRRQGNSVQAMLRCSDDLVADGYCRSDAAPVQSDDGVSIVPNRRLMLDDCVAAACRQFGITERERDIVALLQKGHSNLSMAYSLNISIRTVENHLRAIYFKTSVGSRTQLLSKINSSAIGIFSASPLVGAKDPLKD